jgi:dihydrofolate reductase
VPRLRVHNYSISLDGYAAGVDQGVDQPLGAGGERLHEWAFATPDATDVGGTDTKDRGIDTDFVARGDEGVGATIMGRNMFGPVRGPWGDEEWRGWWGDDPPFHHDVFVLTHHAREPIEMAGGTTFHFVQGSIEQALERAFDAAGGEDVRLGGGASTIQQYLRARLVDELHIVVVPVLLGAGVRLFEDLDGALDSYEPVEFVGSPAVAHYRLVRRRE